jgi:hypothetical protein
MSTTNAQTSAMMPAELSLLTNDNENIPPFSSVSIALPSVPPLDDDLKPAFYPGAYVQVDRDYSPGKKRQEGYGWATKVAGVGAATLVSVETDGCLHKDITIDHLTAAVFGTYGESPPKRKRKQVESFMTVNLPPQKKQVIDDQSPIEKLIAVLQDGASKGKKKGWYLKEIRATTSTDKDKERLSNDESQRLWTEVQLLESYLKYSQSGKPKWKKNRITGKFLKSSATSKALTTTYLVRSVARSLISTSKASKHTTNATSTKSWRLPSLLSHLRILWTMAELA